MKKAEIIKLTKKEIKIISHKSRKKIFLGGLLAVSIALIANFVVMGDDLKSMISRVAHVYNPVNSLYSDNSNAIFTSGIIQDKELLNFIIPIKSSSYEMISDGSISFSVVNSIMVMASEDGVVEDVGFTIDGVKYIKIKHSLNIYSIVENVNIVGVVSGDVVKKGQDIATAIQGTKISFKLYENDMIITNLKVNQSKILWEK